MTPEGPGSVSGAPNLPAGFKDTFTSRFIDTGKVRLHAVVGGDGPPLLLVHGWPENWYAWRLLMPELATNFEVIAVDQRGMGLSDKPKDGYDTVSGQRTAFLTRRSRSERRGMAAKCSFQSLGVSSSTWEAGCVSRRCSTSTR